ncbi:hypothetical protein HYDPIDRAFT_103052, partial [Hydnomerulius pinastri MD-312]
MIEGLLHELPADFPENNSTIFTRLTNPFNPQRVAYIVKTATYGDSLSPEQRKQVEELVAQFADIFAGSLAEVLQVPGTSHKLNIPEGTKFNIRVHQRALTPPQLKFLNERIDEMLKAGIIEPAPPEGVKCCATTVLAQKAH